MWLCPRGTLLGTCWHSLRPQRCSPSASSASEVAHETWLSFSCPTPAVLLGLPSRRPHNDYLITSYAKVQLHLLLLGVGRCNAFIGRHYELQVQEGGVIRHRPHTLTRLWLWRPQVGWLLDTTPSCKYLRKDSISNQSLTCVPCTL
jgi:hypothetical protein